MSCACICVCDIRFHVFRVRDSSVLLHSKKDRDCRHRQCNLLGSMGEGISYLVLCLVEVVVLVEGVVKPDQTSV